MKKQKDILLIMAISVLSVAVLYVAWCWAAKIIWGVEPPEGTSLAVIAGVGCQLMGGAGIQIFKKIAKTDSLLREENKDLKKQLAEKNKLLSSIRRKVGAEQQRIDEV